MGECTMICLDNSEWMRNGDYSRTRFEAQHEGAHAVLGFRSQNPVSTVGVLSLAGGSGVGVQVLCSPTDEKIRVMRAFATASVGGKADVVTGLRVAQLALKYKEAHFRSRIVLFVGSPIEEEQGTRLIKVAKALRKNNVAVDIISMGEHDHNKEILEAFHGAVNKGDNSALIVVPPGTFPEDVINKEFRSDEANQFAEYGGVNPEEDPELAQALRQSMQEHQQQQQQQTDSSGNTGGGSGAQEQGGLMETAMDDNEEDEMLKRAMEMSLANAEGNNEESDSKEETKSKEETSKSKSKEENMLDPSFMKNLVKDLPGVDVDSEEIKSLLKGEEGKEEDDKDKKKDDKKSKDKE